MKTTAVLNLKGGVAKTVTVVNTAAILALDYHQRVLVVDADSQCNSTEFLGGNPAKGNLAELLRGKAGSTDAGEFFSLQPTSITGVDLLAADESLMDLDLSKVEGGTVKINCLRDLTATCATIGRYDRILIDCPPAFNAASAAALIAADDVIIPIKPDAFSLRGMGNLMRQIHNMQAINPNLKLAGLLPTMWYKSDNIISAEATLRKSGLTVYPHIRRTPKVDDMTFLQAPLVVSSPTSAACKDYRAFVAQLVGGADNV